MGANPRYVPPDGAVVEVSNRTMQGRFLLRPSPETNDLVLGVIGRAQRLYGVVIYATQVLSDHYHMLLWVRSAQQMARFMEYVDGNIAREVGKLVSWEGKFWHGPYYSAIVNPTEQSQIARLRYIFSNGCKEGLVASPLDWPGVSSTHALLSGSMTLTGTWYDRSREYRARLGGRRVVFPEKEQVVLSRLPGLEELGSTEFQSLVRSLVQEIEEETTLRHRTDGTRPAGRRVVMRQHPHRIPKKMKRSRATKFLAAPGESVAGLVSAYEAFIASYREAADRMKAGDYFAQFPLGCFPPRLPFVSASPLAPG